MTDEKIKLIIGSLLHDIGKIGIPDRILNKPERLTDLLCTLRECHLEPKRLRFVCKTAEAAPSLVLCESRRGGKPGLSIEPPLLLRTAAGTPTPEVDAIYFRQQEELP